MNNNITEQTPIEQLDATYKKCSQCGAELKGPYKFCPKCGKEIASTTNEPLPVPPVTKVVVTPNNFNPIYNNSEEELLNKFIDQELKKAGIEPDKKIVTSDILKRKNIFTIIFTVLVFVYISLIFFHFPMKTYIIGLIILLIYCKYTKKYDFMTYLKKEIKGRPGEKISNIVMSAKNSIVEDNLKKVRPLMIFAAFLLPLLIFKDPRIMYEKTNGGYNVRFYTFGLTNFTTASIPETYKKENVVGLRGNTFSNMYFLKKVSLPDTITEIRGQAFKNDKHLKNITLPNKLEYLGGGAFSNCTSLTEISLPDTLTYMGGETFSHASSLSKVELSENLTEIRGNSFEYCTSLSEIRIPDNVERIGGHAFFGASALANVELTPNSKLNEIGSSAFRECNSLYSITIPKNISVNERAFKDSPTNINYFGEINYGHLIDSGKYKYDTFDYLYQGVETKIGKSYPTVNVENVTLKIDSVNVLNGGNEFNIKYSGPNGELTFTLSQAVPYKVINENLAVEISGEEMFRRTSAISIRLYYN